MKVRYVGPIDVVILATGEQVEQDETIEVADDLGRLLLQQRENFEPVNEAGREYVTALDAIQDKTPEAERDLDLDRLTRRQLRVYAEQRDIDVAGVELKPDLIRVIFQHLYPQPADDKTGR